MEFALLVLVNIVMATIFYLVIRLKLENTASGYREKKLKREIDEIISEFNEVAERNISILESRISSMKRILEKSGDLKSVDIQIDDADHVIKSKLPENRPPAEVSPDVMIPAEKSTGREISYNSKRDFKIFLRDAIALSRKAFFSLKVVIINKYINYKNSLNDFLKDVSVSLENGQASGNGEKGTGNDAPLDNDAKADVEAGGVQPDAGGHNREIVKNLAAEMPLLLSEGEISEMFIKTDDKYLLISELYHKGYSANIITKCSGIPMGEVKLVLDLNGSV